MSMTKITLSVDEGIKSKANSISRRRNTSVSAMFSRYVAAMAIQEPPTDLPPMTKRALALTEGMAPLPENWNYREELADAMAEKYDEK